MRKLTQILKLYHTTNFMEEANSTGKVIDFGKESVFSLLPVPELAQRIVSLNGSISTDIHLTQLQLPFDFSTNPPATPVASLPNELFFFIRIVNKEKARFCGLNLNGRLLWVEPLPGTSEYLLNKKTVDCSTCGVNPVISAGDLVDHISATATLDEIHTLLNEPLGDDNHLLDLKVTVNATVIKVTKDDDLKLLQAALREAVYTTVPISFSKNSDNTLLKDFPQVLVTPASLPPDIIGIARIPVTGLTVNDISPDNYPELNNFILHFPALQSIVKLTVNTPVFDGSSKLFLDAQEIAGPAIVNHPKMPGYKQITALVNGYSIYANKYKQVTVQNGARKNSTTVDPMNNYNPATNTSTIILTK